MTTDRDDGHGGLDEQAALYAAGALPPDEARAAEARLAAAGRAAWAGFGAVAAKLAAAAAAPPPPAARAALLARLAAPAPLFVAREAPEAWEDTGVPGVRRRVLFVDRAAGRCTMLMRMAAGGVFPAHEHRGVEECLVLEGDLLSNGVALRAGDYQRAEPGTHHESLTTEHGCLVLLSAPLPG
jgi:anti-sigma factor ChrR (cupin superfamily)